MSTNRLARWLGAARHQRVLRVALSHYVLNGASCAFGMLLVSALMHAVFGAEAAATATVGVIAALAPDVVGPRRGKLAHLVVAPLIGVPLFLAVQLLRAHPVALGLFLVAATFFVFLGMAWGKRGAPVAIGVMLVMIFSLSTPPASDSGQALARRRFGKPTMRLSSSSHSFRRAQRRLSRSVSRGAACRRGLDSKHSRNR